MKYYLVGIIDKETYKKIEDIQIELSTTYDLYESLPTLHMTLEIIETSFLDNLKKDLNIMLRDTNKIPIIIENGICFEPPYKSVNFEVKKTKEIILFINQLNKKLKEKGYKVRDNINNWDLHISVANSNFSKREWTTTEFNDACRIVIGKKYNLNPIIEEIQLWKPVNDKDTMVKFSTKLKETNH